MLPLCSFLFAEARPHLLGPACQTMGAATGREESICLKHRLHPFPGRAEMSQDLPGWCPQPLGATQSSAV